MLLKTLLMLVLLKTLFPQSQTCDLDHMISQLLMVSFESKDQDESLRFLIHDLQVGGVIYYPWANDLSEPCKVRTLSDQLHAMAKEPLLIAVDEEGGLVSRLGPGFVTFPGQRVLGELDDELLTEQAACCLAKEVVSAGINLNFSPVVDVNLEQDNPIIGIRAFSSQADVVTRHAGSMINSFKKHGLFSTLKHFPGHGDVKKDSHFDLPYLDKSLDELKACELMPFHKLASLADAVMTAHIVAKPFDETLPVTFSKKALDYLRTECSFEGVIISDSLTMKSLDVICLSLEEKALRALKAGCDMLLLGAQELEESKKLSAMRLDQVLSVHSCLKEAVLTGDISYEKICASYDRIRALKEKIRAQQPDFDKASFEKLAQNMARAALKKIGNASEKITNLQVICHETLGIEKTKFTSHHIKKFGPQSGYEISELDPNMPVVILSYDALKHDSEKHLIQSLLNRYKESILVLTKNPEDDRFFKNASVIYKTFSPTIFSLDQLYEEIMTP